MARTGLAYATVDVFTNDKFTGNQLAIVELSNTDLTQEQKQNIAKEFNFSETVFVHPYGNARNKWTIDIFTTSEELPFAGHPVIGTACFLLARLNPEDALSKKVSTGTFNTKAGSILLGYNSENRTARAEIPHNVHIHKELLQSTQLTKLQPKLGRIPESSPIVSIVKGVTFALIELDSLDSLTFVNATAFPLDATLDADWDASFLGCYFYYKMPRQNTGAVRLRTRMIESSIGEDAATGSAACTLAAYLTMQEGKTGGPGYPMSFEIVQGVELGRRSEIGVRVMLGNDRKVEKVHLSGNSVQIMEGKIFL